MVRRDNDDASSGHDQPQHFDNPAYHVDVETGGGGSDDGPGTTSSAAGMSSSRAKAKISICSDSSGESDAVNVDSVMRAGAEGRKVEFTTIAEDDPDGYFMARNK
jgi:hypothetical protein